MRKSIHGLGAVVLAMGLLSSCTSKPLAQVSNLTAPDTQSSKGDDLQVAMDRLENSIHNPSAPFHASFKKSNSDGFSYLCQVDVSHDGIIGQQVDNSPASKIGTDVFPATTRTRQLNGTPYGSSDWQIAYSGIAMAFLNGHIGDAQPGVKYVGDEETGGFNARHYDFDLTGVDANIKKVMELGNALGQRQTKDYNVKGSAWIAQEDGRMVKFSFDDLYTFTDGTISSTHFEGVVNKK